MKARWFWPTALVVGVGLAAAADPVIRPIDRAATGQWILERHSTATSAVTTETTYNTTWVEKVVGRKVHLLQQMVSSDQKTGIAAATPSVVDLDQATAAAPWNESKGVLVTDEPITIGEKVLRCKKTEVVKIDPPQDKLTTITWTSPDVPLFGLVKTVKLDRDGREIERMELTAWGDTGGAELPVAQRP